MITEDEEVLEQHVVACRENLRPCIEIRALAQRHTHQSRIECVEIGQDKDLVTDDFDIVLVSGPPGQQQTCLGIGRIGIDHPIFVAQTGAGTDHDPAAVATLFKTDRKGDIDLFVDQHIIGGIVPESMPEHFVRPQGHGVLGDVEQRAVVVGPGVHRRQCHRCDPAAIRRLSRSRTRRV